MVDLIPDSCTTILEPCAGSGNCYTGKTEFKTFESLNY